MTLNELLSQKNPPAKSELKLTYKDFIRFFWKHKGLLKTLERNNAFWESTNDNLKTAYERLDEQERALERAYGMNKKYLDNIKEGLLLINKDFLVLPQYSKYMEEIFKINKIEGLHFIDLIYPDNLSHNQASREELNHFLSILFNNTSADFEMIMEINPLKDKKISIITKDNKVEDKIINVDFIRIYEGSNIENIMAIIVDKTNIAKLQIKLEMEKDKHAAEIESISAIIKAGPITFNDFCAESKQVMKEFEKNREKLNIKNIVNYLFRQMHSLKGSAKYFELNHLSSHAHKAEDILAKIKSNPSMSNQEIQAELDSYLKKINFELENIEKITDKFLTFSKELSQSVSLTNAELLDQFLVNLEEMAVKISKEIGKSVQLKINNSLPELPRLNKLKNPIIHLIRNCIDHGIEDPLVRENLNKNKTGMIKMNLFQKDKNIVFEIIDDGKGIDFEKIKEKAIEKNLIIINDKSVTKSKLLSIMFLPNFSSRNEISDISGRGFGLDIVKDVIESLGGEILVHTKKNMGTKFSLKYPV